MLGIVFLRFFFGVKNPLGISETGGFQNSQTNKVCSETEGFQESLLPHEIKKTQFQKNT